MVIGLIFISIMMVLFFVFALKIIEKKEYLSLMIFTLVYFLLCSAVASKLLQPNIDIFKTGLSQDFVAALIAAIGVIVVYKYHK